MSETTISKNTDTIKLEILQQYVAKVLGEGGLNLVDPKLEMQRRIEFIDDLLVQIRTGVLADHVEHKEATYTIVELPKWLKWLERFTVKHTRLLKLDAYHTYPKANIKLPKLNKSYINIVKQDYEL